MRMRSAILSVFLIGLVDGLAFTNGPSRTRFQKTALSMATSGALNCRPIGVGSAAPKTVVTNDDLENIVETNDEWISSRTGISQRRLLTHFNGEEGEEKENLVTISQEAAANALEMSGLDALDIDMVICCTSSPDDMFGDATSIAAGIGCKNAVAFDITAACSGFLFGSVTAGQFLHNKSIKNAIVVGADALSRWVDWDDRNSCILFGDGAGAVVYTASDEPGMLGYSAHSNGLGHDDLMLGYKGEKRMIATPGEGTELSSGSYDNISMNGREVYKFATREVPVVLKEALEAANMTVDDIDWLLLHQANIRIIDIVAERLGIPKEKIITNLKNYGNTSAGSIPLALDEAVRSGQVKKGDIVACAGFGAGLSWGSTILKWG
uniref:beta-ketoacyl-[acyl-carrier-protein] synthase III n=1 Tax=Proboscia inermis TaxID=420281 RepID=A0A7S0CKF3_9STRA|mmetsp:Transcript_5295/g.5527  ORF Transcript_5295/g.5527 Transcript_5295/m.5527 type:complete len:380 (+) Transcript_5295:140-1279(+)